MLSREELRKARQRVCLVATKRSSLRVDARGEKFRTYRQASRVKPCPRRPATSEKRSPEDVAAESRSAMSRHFSRSSVLVRKVNGSCVTDIERRTKLKAF